MAVDDLIARVVQGDPAAFTRMYEEHCKEVYTIALALTGNVSMAEDITQDVFTAVWNDTSVVERGLRTTLCQLTRDKALGYRRGRSLRLVPFEEIDDGLYADSGNNQGEEVGIQELHQIAAQAVGALPEKYRTAVELWQQNLTHRQIAGMLHIPMSTSRGRRQRALQKLQCYGNSLR